MWWSSLRQYTNRIDKWKEEKKSSAFNERKKKNFFECKKIFSSYALKISLLLCWSWISKIQYQKEWKKFSFGIFRVVFTLQIPRQVFVGIDITLQLDTTPTEISVLDTKY